MVIVLQCDNDNHFNCFLTITIVYNDTMNTPAGLDKRKSMWYSSGASKNTA